MAVRLSALVPGHVLPPGRFVVLISVRGRANSRVIVRLEVLGKLLIVAQQAISLGSLLTVFFTYLIPAKRALNYRPAQ
jgi:hypothetical protein